jgi:hypothetical protein
MRSFSWISGRCFDCAEQPFSGARHSHILIEWDKGEVGKRYDFSHTRLRDLSHIDEARESQVSAHTACCQVVHMSQSYCKTSAKKP